MHAQPSSHPLRTLLLAAWAALSAIVAPHALAQRADEVRATDARWVIVLTDETPLRCGDFERFYPIASLRANQPLRLDGQSETWARVEYPLRLAALVSARDVERVDDATLRLVRPSKLRAANTNPDVGVAGSWRSVFQEPLPVGTTLQLTEEIQSSSGDLEGYRVIPPRPPVAPHRPHAFLPLDAVREATFEERVRLDEAYENREALAPVDQLPTPGGATEAPEAVEATAPANQPADQSADAGMPDADEPAAEPNTEPNTAPDTEQAADPQAEAPQVDDETAPSTTPPATDPSPADEATPATLADTDPSTDPAAGTEQPVDDSAATGASDTEAPDAESTPATDPEGEPEAEPEPPAPLTLEELEEEFTRVRGLGRRALDDSLDEIINEFRRTRATLGDRTLLRIADSRIEWLEIRRETRDERRALEAALADADGRTQVVRDRLAQLEQSRRYAVVGRLVPSALYAGERLPLLYRVESIAGSSAPRTLGYIRPAQSEGLETKLGELVGVVGEVKLQRDLGLRLITPVRVDVLTAETE